MFNSRQKKIYGLLLGFVLTAVLFQNCSKSGFSPAGVSPVASTDSSSSAPVDTTTNPPPPSSGGTSTVVVKLAQSSASVAAGGTFQFSASVTGSSDTTVNWSIQEGSVGGIIAASGVYTAPVNPGTYHILVKANAAPSAMAIGTVVVTNGVLVPPTPPAALLFPPDIPMALMTLGQPSLGEPPLGASVIYSDLGTTVTHASNRLHHYAKNPVWNSDETYALVYSIPEKFNASLDYLIDGKTYADIKGLNTGQDPWFNEYRTWGNTSPYYIYGVGTGYTWLRLDVRTSTVATLRTYLPADFGLSSMSFLSYGSYEGTIDDKDTGAVLMSGGIDPDTNTSAILINPQTGAIRCRVTGGGSYGEVILDASVSHDGQFFSLNYTDTLSIYRAVDGGSGTSCPFVRNISPWGHGHYDWCVSSAGDQVTVEEGTTMYMVNAATGASTAIYGPDTYNEHVSCRNTKRPGWVYVSQSNYSCAAGAPAYEGKLIHNKLIAVKLDGSKTVEVFAWDHQPCPSTEAGTDFAVPSPTGTRVWWKTNWNGSSSGVHSFVAEKKK